MSDKTELAFLFPISWNLFLVDFPLHIKTFGDMMGTVHNIHFYLGASLLLLKCS
jgi:hypothetical protein